MISVGLTLACWPSGWEPRRRPAQVRTVPHPHTLAFSEHHWSLVWCLLMVNVVTVDKVKVLRHVRTGIVIHLAFLFAKFTQYCTYQQILEWLDCGRLSWQRTRWILRSPPERFASPASGRFRPAYGKMRMCGWICRCSNVEHVKCGKILRILSADMIGKVRRCGCWKSIPLCLLSYSAGQTYTVIPSEWYEARPVCDSWVRYTLMHRRRRRRKTSSPSSNDVAVDEYDDDVLRRRRRGWTIERRRHSQWRI